MPITPPGGSPGPLAPTSAPKNDIILRQGHTDANLYGNSPTPQTVSGEVSPDRKELHAI